MPGAPVRLAVYEWSGPNDQDVIVEWTTLHDSATVYRIADQLAAVTRSITSPATALGTAMQTGAALLAMQPECWKRTLDISGDGKHNLGPHPRDVSNRLQHEGLTINALVIGADSPGIGDLRQVEIGELASYFDAYVKTGPDAFVETAIGFEDYHAAMVRKLKRELEGLILSSLTRPH